MSTYDQEYKFKGDAFENRYRIQGVLETQSPLHIGSGTRRREKLDAIENDRAKAEETVDIDEVVRDANGLPYIPGSSLRGVVRHYLLKIFQHYNPNIATAQDYDADDFRTMEQRRAVEYMRTGASMLERLFGTPFCASKAEFWDAKLKQKIHASSKKKKKGWDDERQTYPVRSVAIDPQTGAAEKNKLYTFDVVPAGAQFEVNIVGQNLNDAELGFLFFGLFGFNSEIFPLTLGAMAGRGFGRMRFKVENIYRLQANDLENWVNVALMNEHAGYNLFQHLQPAEADKLLNQFKSEFLSAYKPESQQ